MEYKWIDVEPLGRGIRCDVHVPLCQRSARLARSPTSTHVFSAGHETPLKPVSAGCRVGGCSVAQAVPFQRMATGFEARPTTMQCARLQQDSPATSNELLKPPAACV